MKKIAIFSLFSLCILLAPRHYSVSKASDCFWVMQNGNWTCQNYNQNNAPTYYTQTYNNSHPNLWGHIWQQGQLTRTSAQCLYNATITWQTTGTNNVQVTVADQSSNTEKLFSTDTQGNSQAPWISPNNSYHFTLWDTSNGGKTMLDQVWVTGFGLDCGVPAGGQYLPGGGTITMSSNQNYCVGQTPTYTVQASGWQNQTMQWTSWFNNQQVNQQTFSLDSNGYFSGSGNTWSSSDVGHWKKVITGFGTTQTLEFNVTNCGNQSSNNNFYSSGNNQSYSNNQNSYSGTSGNFSLSWNNAVCVGQTPTYTISSNSSWSNQTISWQSSGPSGSFQTTATLDNNGNFNGNGATWQQSDVGNWTKTATIHSITQTINFTVINCNNSYTNNTSQTQNNNFNYPGLNLPFTQPPPIPSYLQ